MDDVRDRRQVVPGERRTPVAAQPKFAGTGRQVAAFRYESLPGRVVFRAGCSRTDLLAEVERLAARRVLLVVSDRERPLAEQLTAPLGRRLAGTVAGVRPHVPVGDVQRACSVAAEVGADALLSIGGGSTTGLAKAVALRTALPVVAVPTTYAGSEMTPVWGTTDGSRKTTGRSLLALPTCVLYDPDLTLGLPLPLTVASAMNAMAHCIEAFYAAGANPLTDLVAAEGVRALGDGLRSVVADPHGAAGREQLLWGAHLAGCAFAVAGSGLHHTVCHVLGGAFGLPHAQTHAVVLPYVVAFHEAFVPGLRRAADSLGAGSLGAGSLGAGSLGAGSLGAGSLGTGSLTRGLLRLTAGLGGPASLLDLGMTESDLDLAVHLVTSSDLSGNPRPVREADVRRLLTAALHGEEPRGAGDQQGPRGAGDQQGPAPACDLPVREPAL